MNPADSTIKDGPEGLESVVHHFLDILYEITNTDPEEEPVEYPPQDEIAINTR